MLRLQGLSKQFGKELVLKDISLELREGERLRLSGPSGSGKSTLLLCIAGLLEPDAGEIFMDNNPVTPQSLPPHRRGIGLALQDPTLWPHMTVAGNAGYGVHGLTKRQRAARVAELLDDLGLEGMQKSRPHQLSGGEARRVALARCLAPKPRLLLMDEPLVNLDPQTKERALACIRKQLKQTGASMIFVSHDPDNSHGLCNRQAVLRQGELTGGEALP
ncbi:ABC transporter ATP-binding protein [Desulfovibrio inopinatus]|uniref:ABC transporter ATP-binding protein n=1 Tax=Desulfovibrio inopinatus TaxID=102109 RepID=UPI00146FB72B|nr:ABC transporter ATP-binding protein [Desulfovibrio inopinatus]